MSNWKEYPQEHRNSRELIRDFASVAFWSIVVSVVASVLVNWVLTPLATKGM